MKRLGLIMGWLVVVALAVFLATISRPKPAVPATIMQAVTSTILIPKSSDVTIARQSIKYDAPLKLLSYSTTAYGVPVVVSEQPTPESFIDVPQVYDKVVSSMNEYSKFDSETGTVHLTRPKDLGGKQAAVMNAKGTLMFAKPERDLSTDQWRKLFNSLEIVK